MMTDAAQSKPLMRSAARRRLASLPAERGEADSRIIRSLSGLSGLFGHGATLGGYIAIQREPELTSWFRRVSSSGVRLLLPRFCPSTSDYEMVPVQRMETDLIPGAYAIPEPVPALPGLRPPYPASVIGVWVIPALSFDRGGHRLGRGGGYYDRLLRGAGGVKIGVCYDCQLADAIPSEVHDIRMDYVVTESQVLLCD